MLKHVRRCLKIFERILSREIEQWYFRNLSSLSALENITIDVSFQHEAKYSVHIHPLKISPMSKMHFFPQILRALFDILSGLEHFFWEAYERRLKLHPERKKWIQGGPSYHIFKLLIRYGCHLDGRWQGSEIVRPLMMRNIWLFEYYHKRDCPSHHAGNFQLETSLGDANLV